MALDLSGTTFTSVPKLRAPRTIWSVKGLPKTGKNRFAFTAPSDIVLHRFDTSSQGALEEMQFGTKGLRIYTHDYTPPILPTGIVALTDQQLKDQYKPVLDNFDRNFRALAPRARTTIIDTESELWQIQRLAQYGKITQIVALQYANLNRAVTEWVRLFEQGENNNLILLSQAREEWGNGTDDKGKAIRVKTGRLERMGSDAADFLVQAFFNAGYIEAQIGPQGQVLEPAHFYLDLVRSDTNADLVGMRWWDKQITFQNVASALYPKVPAEAWDDPNPVQA